MKIYFTAAISQRDNYGRYYKRIVDQLLKVGHKVQYEHILGQDVVEIFGESDEKKIEYYKKFLKWVNQADVLVAEASFPSTVNVGHEISIALGKEKPVVVLYLKGKSPVFLEGIESEKLLIEEYGDSDLEEVVSSSVEFASEQQDTRFNFFIAPKHQHFLDWVSRKKMVPRAVHLRRLLERDMAANREYQDELAGSSSQNSNKVAKSSGKVK